MIDVLDWEIFDRMRTGKVIRVIDRLIDLAGMPKLGTNWVVNWDVASSFELLGDHGPVIVVFVDGRASSHNDVSLGSGDGGGRGDDSVAANSMGATAALTVREGDELAGLVQSVVIR